MVKVVHHNGQATHFPLVLIKEDACSDDFISKKLFENELMPRGDVFSTAPSSTFEINKEIPQVEALQM